MKTFILALAFITKHMHYRQKIWNIFYLCDFVHICGVWRVFLYLKYIPTGRYYPLGELISTKQQYEPQRFKNNYCGIFLN